MGIKELDRNIEDIMEALSKKGINYLKVQMGNGSFQPIRLKKHPQGEVVQYIKSEQMPLVIAGAKMIISHAGAGSIIEGLSARKPLLVVINQTLMDNHQFEIAEEMAKRGHIQMSTT